MEDLTNVAFFSPNFYGIYRDIVNAPIYHLMFEAFLALWIIKLLFIRSYRLRSKHDGLGAGSLTEKEKEELIREWIPEPLVPLQKLEKSSVLVPEDKVLEERETNLIQGFKGEYIYIVNTTDKADSLSTISRFLDFASYNFLNLTDSEIYYDSISQANTFNNDEKTPTARIRNRLDEDINYKKEEASKDYLIKNDLNAIAISSLRRYGTGSCGPRGFYGTIDIHLALENTLASFIHSSILCSPTSNIVPSCDLSLNSSSSTKPSTLCSSTLQSSSDFSNSHSSLTSSMNPSHPNPSTSQMEACIYSLGLATAASVIPAFAKRGDVVFADEAVCFGIQRGLQASRSVIKFFRHNDVSHLRELLEIQDQAETKDPAKAKVTKKFIIVEGIYQYTGEMCPLPQIVEFRKRYKARVFIEESISYGILGTTGKGVTEYYGIDLNEVDLVIGSLENSLGSIGGFCVGKKYIIENNYLSGLGYCFSASLPPIQASAARAALNLIKDNPQIIKNLKKNSNLFRRLMITRIEDYSQLASQHSLRFELSGHQDSPLAYLRVRFVKTDIKNVSDTLIYSADKCEILEKKFAHVAKELKIKHGIMVCVPKYLKKEEMSMINHPLVSSKDGTGNLRKSPQFNIIGPALKICIKRMLTKEQITLTINHLWEEIEYVFF
ncbi:unnamed protein product [Gordionus sp. m RMFG-2023]|uniref:serine palmitoyltransferase 1-like n=1 Tax=Gordionus sp. m RMFG-2023 TaxID=3053472 RepID=UPI0030E16F63